MKLRYLVVAVFTLGLLAGMGGCQRKSEEQLAQEALDRGLQAYAAGRIDEAAAAYREVLDHDKQNKWAFYNLGVIDQASGRDQAAEYNYRLALNVDPDFPSALFNLAVVRFKAGSTQEAADLYRHLVAVQPNNAAAHLNLGFALIGLGKLDEGNAEIARAVQLDPGLAQPAPIEPTGSPAAKSTP
ncbi:MAG: tetratricopeptide repeat protein [Anaerolineae bacterium]